MDGTAAAAVIPAVITPLFYIRVAVVEAQTSEPPKTPLILTGLSLLAAEAEGAELPVLVILDLVVMAEAHQVRMAY